MTPEGYGNAGAIPDPHNGDVPGDSAEFQDEIVSTNPDVVHSLDVHGALSPENYEQLRETGFKIIIDTHLAETMSDAMYDSQYFETTSDENDFLASLSEFNRDEQLQILSLPNDLRENRLLALKEQGVSVSDVPKVLFEEASTHGFTVGYHVSPHEIKPNRDGEQETWNIDGTELDDRDDRLMAYYSLDHKNLYRQKRGDYIYMVRAHIGEDTAHKRDQSNNWGRADKLAVVSQMENLSAIEDRINDSIEEIKKRAST